MRIALAVGMVPRSNTNGTHVRVPSGKWRATHNAITSQLALIINDIERDINEVFHLEETSQVSLIIKESGKERYILAFLEAA